MPPFTKCQNAEMEIVPGVHSIPGIRWSRAYLIVDDTLALVDAGLPWDAGRIVRYIRSIGRRPDELGMVLTTHSHPDHTGGALSITRRTGAEVVAHARDTKTHADRAVSLSYLGVFSALKVPVPFLRRTPARPIGDGHVLPLLGGIKAIHTRGTRRVACASYWRAEGCCSQAIRCSATEREYSGPCHSPEQTFYCTRGHWSGWRNLTSTSSVADTALSW